MAPSDAGEDSGKEIGNGEGENQDEENLEDEEEQADSTLKFIKSTTPKKRAAKSTPKMAPTAIPKPDSAFYHRRLT